MKSIYKTIIICTLIGLVSAGTSYNVLAGNRDRSGQAGAQHLLIDPWARSNGMANACVAETRGLEALYSNVAGISFVEKTEFSFNRTQYLAGSNAGISISSIGFVQHLSSKGKYYGTLGVSFFSQSFGDIDITTVSQPEGGLGTFSPTLMYLGLHYAYSFNNFIHGGLSVKVINESISDLSATGFAIDAGVQYLTGKYENFKIGVTLKNIGLPMSFGGDGMSFRGTISNTDVEQTVNIRSAEFEMPSLLSIGFSYDFLFFGGEYAKMTKSDREAEGLTRDNATHRITLAGAFTANSYSRDIFALGLEYGFMNYFMVRAGYSFENIEMTDAEKSLSSMMFNSESFFAGPSVGATAVIPLKKGNTGSRIYIDYAYRFTHIYQGSHYIGIKVSL